MNNTNISQVLYNNADAAFKNNITSNSTINTDIVSNYYFFYCMMGIYLLIALTCGALGGPKNLRLSYRRIIKPQLSAPQPDINLSREASTIPLESLSLPTDDSSPPPYDGLYQCNDLPKYSDIYCITNADVEPMITRETNV